MCLWEFSWNFCDFRSIFRAFKQFLEFFWNCFRIKNNFEKNKQTLSNWAEPEGPTQVRAGPAVGPCGAHLRPAQAHRLACPWRTRRRRRPSPPWRERPGVLGGPHCCLMRARAPAAARVPCALVRHRLRKPRTAGQCAAATADFPAACRPHEQSKAWARVIDSLDVEAAGASWRCLGVRLVESHPRSPCRCRRIELCTGRRRLPAPQASPPRFGARERSQSKTPPPGGFPCQATHPRLPVVAAPPPVPADPWSLLQAQPFLSTHVGAVFPDELHTSEIPVLSSFSFSVCC
jgi:hypothetical protein